MFFFRVELSLFDEDRQTIFLIPETREPDEIPVFSERQLTANPAFKKYTKQHKTGVVDVKYELFKSTAVCEEITDEAFEKMQNENTLDLLDGNEFCIINGKERMRSKSKSSTPIFAIIAIAFVLILALSAMSQAGKHIDGTLDSSDLISENSEDSADENSDTSSENSSDESEESSTSSTESEESSSKSDSENSTEGAESDDISDNSEIMESNDGESFDFPPPEDIQHL